MDYVYKCMHCGAYRTAEALCDATGFKRLHCLTEGVLRFHSFIRNNDKSRKADEISHPIHYTAGEIEVWDFIEDQGLDYFLGNVIKYTCRAFLKGAPLKDLKKARAYLDKKINKLEKEET